MKWCNRVKNIIVLNMARYMLIAKIIPKEFWAKDVYGVVYLVNCTSTMNMKDETL